MISVIMPVYNSEKYLRDAVSSVLGQTYTDLELIAVNDGSTDSSLEILREAAASDKRVRIIDQPNGGVSRARNAGLDAASGEWIYCMDSDDVIESSMMEEMLNLSEGCDVVISGVIEHDLRKGEDAVSPYALPDAVLRSPGEIGDYLEKVISDPRRSVFFNFLWERMFRASVIREHHIRFEEDVRLGEDFLFNSAVLKEAGSVRVIGRAWYHYFIRDYQSLVTRFYADELERRKRIYGGMTDLYKAYGRYESSRDRLEMNEGQTSWIGVNKVKYPTCTLSRKEKVHYIDGFLKDERRKYMEKYLSTAKGRRNALKRRAVKAGNARILYLLIGKQKKI